MKAFLDSAPGLVPPLVGPIDRLSEGAVSLLLFKCLGCNRLQFGQGSAICSCGHRVERIVTADRVATLYSYTVVRHAPPGLEGEFAPYIIGLVNVAPDVLVLARIESQSEDPAIGASCKLTPFPLQHQGAPAIGFCYKVIGDV